MTTAEWITVAAIVAGPILAVQAQKWLEVLREDKNRRLNIFKRLMATRGAPLSWVHVEALNSIDLEFSGDDKENKKVRDRWGEYRDHLYRLSQDPAEQREQLQRWTERKDELLAQLLRDMGSAVGYNFNIVEIRRGIYSPQGHANFELENQALRRLSLEVLSGSRALPLDIRSLPNVGAATTAPTQSSPPLPEPPSGTVT